MENFTVFGRPGCGFCVQAKKVLEQKGLPVKYVDIQAENISQADLEKTVGKPVRSVPQVFHGEKHLGGYQELVEYLKTLDS